MEAKELRERILKLVDEKHISSNGLCGLSPVSIKNQLGVGYRELAEQLNYLDKNKLIWVRKGINGYLLFKQKPLR